MIFLTTHKLFTGLTILLLVCSIGVQIMIGIQLQKILNETENMSATENRFLKQCKAKFAGCYEMHHGITNIPVFVDKYLEHIRVGWCSLSFLKHFSGQTMLLAVVASGMGVCVGIVKGEAIVALLPYYVISMAGLYIYVSASAIVDMQGRIGRLRVNLIDFLENHFIARLEEQEAKQETVEEVAQDKKKVRDKAKESDSFTGKEQDELLNLIEELLA